MCKKAKEILAKTGLRMTQPRLRVLEILLENHGPFSVEEIHKRARSKDVDLATVYRCVENFEKAGLVIRMDFRDGLYRYEFHSEKYHHHHLICLCCKKSETVEECSAKKMDRVAEKRGFDKVFHALELFGLCPNCRHEGHAC